MYKTLLPSGIKQIFFAILFLCVVHSLLVHLQNPLCVIFLKSILIFILDANTTYVKKIAIKQLVLQYLMAIKAPKQLNKPTAKSYRRNLFIARRSRRNSSIFFLCITAKNQALHENALHKMKFSIKDFFSKCDQTTFTEEIFNGKTHFSCI